MTSTQDEQQVTQVTEADRKLFSELLISHDVETGRWDDSAPMQAIVAFRIQARKEAIEECAKAMDDQWESHWGAYLRNLANEVE